MIKAFSYAFIISFIAVGSAVSQSSANGKNVEVVVTDRTTTAKAPVPKAAPTPLVVGRPRIAEETQTEAANAAVAVPVASASTGAARVLSFNEIKSKIAEGRRQLQTRPLVTSQVGSRFEGIETVRVAFHNWRTNELDYVVLTKDSFLSTREEKQLTSENGLPITLRTIRGNGVNTPVTITDGSGMNHLPLLVQYPRVANGQFQEMAYYMSTHPGLITPEVVGAGKIYVRNVIDIARDRLRERNITIQPRIADMAERLAVVEHVDHARFRNEIHQSIYNDVFTLFALNEGGTYRYAVSSANAGGMVQMIPSTYRMVRAQYPQVPLMPDFVEGMRDHINAAQAMLLYMQWTWDDLRVRPAISNALLTGIATQEQLMAAGYNSNPARLAGYINRGGANWTTLIPRETQMYLQIYASVVQNVPQTPRTK